MNVPKQLVNLLGAVVIAAVLVAGVLLGALPMVTMSQQTDASTKTVVQTNAVYEIQVAQLREAESRIDEITASVATLREEIAATPQLDDVYEIVIQAADDSGAVIESMAAADPAVWSIRVATDEDGAPLAPEPTETPAAADQTSEDANESAATGETTTTETGTVASGPDAESPQQQVPIAISVTVADARQAADFLDALGAGPRLILPTDAQLSSGTLSVNALAFLQTED